MFIFKDFYATLITKYLTPLEAGELIQNISRYMISDDAEREAICASENRSLPERIVFDIMISDINKEQDIKARRAEGGKRGGRPRKIETLENLTQTKVFEKKPSESKGYLKETLVSERLCEDIHVGKNAINTPELCINGELSTDLCTGCEKEEKNNLKKTKVIFEKPYVSEGFSEKTLVTEGFENDESNNIYNNNNNIYNNINNNIESREVEDNRGSMRGEEGGEESAKAETAAKAEAEHIPPLKTNTPQGVKSPLQEGANNGNCPSPQNPPHAPELDAKTGKTDSESTEAQNAQKRPVKRFIKPSPEEVTKYASEHNMQVDGQQFCDFYESKGWKVGKNPMINWKAAVRTWGRRTNTTPRAAPAQNNIPSQMTNFDGRTYEDMDWNKFYSDI